MLDQVRCGTEVHLHLAANEISRRLHALVGNLGHRQTGTRSEKRRAKMTGAAGAGRGVAELSGVRPHVLDELLERLRGYRDVHGKHICAFTKNRDRREILQRIVVHLLYYRYDRDLRGGGPEQRVAVGRGLRYVFGGDCSRSAHAVLNQELLTESRREPFGNYTRLGVRQATSGVRNDHPDRPLRPGLSLENGRG